MHKLDIYRILDEGQEFGTFSNWHIDDKPKPFCVGVERPWKNNERNISCIPAGKYEAEFYSSPSHGLVYQLIGVPDRGNIQIHSANFFYQLKGCLAPGNDIVMFPLMIKPGAHLTQEQKEILEKYRGKKIKGVTASRDTLTHFMALMEGDPIIKVVIHPLA